MQQTKVKNNITPTKPATIRSKLFEDLKNAKYCAYQGHECNQMSIENSNYCQRHILEDKTAGYKQCSFIYNSNGKRCHLPGMKPDKKDNGYCAEHSLKMHVNKVRSVPRHQPPTTPELLLSSLSHYVKPSRKRNLSSSTQYSDEGHSSTEDQSSSKVTKSLDPFVDIGAFSVNAAASDILDYASDSESDVEAATYASVWHDAQVESSDNESIDSEQEDPLKHASVYTAEEVTLVTKDKLKRLQTLYIEQFQHLQYILRERRRKYLHALRREKETFCSIHNQARDSPKELRLYHKLKSLNQYQKKLGVDAIMHKKRNELRAKITEGLTAKPASITKCAFAEGGVKCGERSLPVARHCRKHILEDPNQILFRVCGRQKGDMQCPTPVEMIFPDATCRLHMEIPVIRNYAQPRKDSESDFDESGGDNQNVEFNNSTLNNTTLIRQSYSEDYMTQSPECSDWSNFQTEQFSADENTMDTDFKIMNPDSMQSYVEEIKREELANEDASESFNVTNMPDKSIECTEELSLNVSETNEDEGAAIATENTGMITEQAEDAAPVAAALEEQVTPDVEDTENVMESTEILKAAAEDAKVPTPDVNVPESVVGKEQTFDEYVLMVPHAESHSFDKEALNNDTVYESSEETFGKEANNVNIEESAEIVTGIVDDCKDLLPEEGITAENVETSPDV